MARIAATRAGLAEIMNAAVAALLEETDADRAAVWIDSCDGAPPQSALASFRGIVAERTGEATPAQWNWLSLDSSPMLELLDRGLTVEHALDGPAGYSMGALLEMRRAVWAPIQIERGLRGIVLAASRNRRASIDQRVLEGVAAEIAMALLLDSGRRSVRERQQDLADTRQMLAALTTAESPDTLLNNLVESCTRNAADDFGTGAAFAVIGELIDMNTPAVSLEDSPNAQTSAPHAVRFFWRSGDAAWTSAMDREPLLSVWRQALESRRVIGNEPGPAGPTELARIVAFPLEEGEATLGVLVAGLRRDNASLATLERLELRAALASQILRKHKQIRDTGLWLNREIALLEACGQPVIFLDSHGRITRVSEKARELLDSGRAASPGNGELLDFLQSFHPRERLRVTAWLEKQSNATRKSRLEAGLPDAELANGRRVRLHAIGQAGSNVLAVLFKPVEAADDVTAENHEQTELLNVIEWLEEGVVLFDARQEIRAMNSRFAQMTGLTPEETTGTRTLQDLILRLARQTAEPERFAARWLSMAQGAQGGVRDEVHLLRPVPRVLERATRPVLNSRGGLLGRVEIYRDLTAQRTFHSKMMQTEKLAALGQMVTSVAHELSNPLTSILGYAQRLLRHQADGQWGEARQIASEAERATTILRQLLLAHDARRERRKVSLNEVVTSTVELQRSDLALQNLRIQLDLDAALPPVLGDAGQLRQVLMNLVANARQSMKLSAKGGTIQVRTKRAGGTHVLLEVIDDGPGVPAAILPKIFDPFFTTKPAGVGTGLGLSIVLGIVREHGGQVRVASPPTGGAVFSIELPAAPGAVAPISGRDAGDDEQQNALFPEDVPAAATERTEGVLSPWAGCLVLVVEDEGTVGQLIADVLRDEGLEVDVLLDGREALRRASSQDYDLVICDMKMPDLDGEQFYRRLARTHNSLRERMLFVTGDVLAARTREFLDRHGLPHLAKPFRVEELTETVRQVLMEISPRKSRAAKTNVARH